MEHILVLHITKKKKNLPLFDHACKTCWFLFQPVLVFVGNLAQNSTDFLCQKSLLVNKIKCFPVFMTCLHFGCFMKITLWAQYLLTKTTTTRIFGCVSLSFKTMHDRTCSQGFLGIQSLVQKQKSCWCLSKTNVWSLRIKYTKKRGGVYNNSIKYI